MRGGDGGTMKLSEHFTEFAEKNNKQTKETMKLTL